MIDISKVDGKSITFNGKTCAAVYKADAGRDGLGEFVLVSETTGEYKTKIRIEELSINGVAYGIHDSADTAAYSLNQFIGNFKKGGGGENGKVEAVNGIEPDGNGNIQLAAMDVGAASTAYADRYAYKELSVDTHMSDSGYLIKLKNGAVAAGTVATIVGYCSYGTPINTVVQFAATSVTDLPPVISHVTGMSYGYALKDLRVFSLLTSSNTYSIYLWIPSVSETTHMGVFVYDSIGGVGQPVGNLAASISLEAALPAASDRFGEVIYTPSSPFPVSGAWTPSLTGAGQIAHTNSYFTKVGDLVRCQTLITTQTVGNGAYAVHLKGLPFPVREGLGTGNQYPVDIQVNAALQKVSYLIGFTGIFSSDSPFQMGILKIINHAGAISFAEIHGSEVAAYTSFRFRFDYLTN